MSNPIAPEQNFQPQVPSTSNGPHLHTYIPRDDTSVLINGQVYVIETPAIAAAQAAATVGVATAVGVVPAVVTQAVPTPAIAVPLAIPTMTSTTQPIHYPQPALFASPPVIQQPYFYPSIAAVHPPPAMHMGATMTMPGGFPPFSQPAFGTMGYTGHEMLHNQLAFAQDQEMNKKQEMKPADDNPTRIYWVREKDGTWTHRNRMTIDSGDIGECRWYALDGQFYAVRLSDG